MTLDDKISFVSGSTFTFMYTAPLYELSMALLLGLFGGIGGMLGKMIFVKIKEKLGK